MRRDRFRALALSMPIRTNPMKPDVASQPIISVQIGLNRTNLTIGNLKRPNQRP
jgi:hypothetical protein